MPSLLQEMARQANQSTVLQPETMTLQIIVQTPWWWLSHKKQCPTKIGRKGTVMGLKTRLDGRAKDNRSFEVKDADGEVIAKVTLLDFQGITLEVSTVGELYIEKPNGWSSKRKTK